MLCNKVKLRRLYNPSYPPHKTRWRGLVTWDLGEETGDKAIGNTKCYMSSMQQNLDATQGWFLKTRILFVQWSVRDLLHQRRCGYLSNPRFLQCFENLLCVCNETQSTCILVSDSMLDKLKQKRELCLSCKVYAVVVWHYIWKLALLREIFKK